MTVIINTLWGEEEVDSKICKECGEELSLDQFYKKKVKQSLSNHLQNYERFCKKCDCKRSNERIRIKKEAPPKPDACESCGEKTKFLYPDHDHVTKEFRGWLCRSCNGGIGQLGDTLEGVMKAVKYLKDRVQNFDNF